MFVLLLKYISNSGRLLVAEYFYIVELILLLKRLCTYSTSANGTATAAATPELGLICKALWINRGASVMVKWDHSSKRNTDIHSEPKEKAQMTVWFDFLKYSFMLYRSPCTMLCTRCASDSVCQTVKNPPLEECVHNGCCWPQKK